MTSAVFRLFINDGMFTIRNVVPRSYLRLGVIILIAFLFSSSIWYYFEDITRPWLPEKPRNTAQAERGIILPTLKFGELKWLQEYDELRQSHTIFVYCMGSNTRRPECHIPRARHGREASAYFSYILDYYDNLPKYSIFVHSLLQQWHNDILGVWTAPAITSLRYEAVDAAGYVNLRCRQDPGCPFSVKPFEPSEEEIRKDNARARFVQSYQYVFNSTEAEVPQAIGAPCCAQFVVTRQQIRRRSKQDYERMLQWLVDNHVDDDFNSGWFFEMTWHIVFGQQALSCSRLEQCHCDLYGWCGPLPHTGEVLKAIGSK